MKKRVIFRFAGNIFPMAIPCKAVKHLHSLSFIIFQKPGYLGLWENLPHPLQIFCPMVGSQNSSVCIEICALNLQSKKNVEGCSEGKKRVSVQSVFLMLIRVRCHLTSWFLKTEVTLHLLGVKNKLCNCN